MNLKKMFELMKKMFVTVKTLLKKVFADIGAHIRKNLPQWIVAMLILLFIAVYFWPSIFITIHSGEAGVYYSRFLGGTVTDKVYPEGFHIIPPWNILTVYNVRVQTTPHDMDVLTNTGLTVHLTLSVRYYPEYDVLGVLHQKVGPDYANKIVIPEVESIMRTIIGRFDAEEVYATKRDIVQKVVNEALEQVSQKYVKIDTVIITNVQLPSKIKDAIERKLEEKQVADAYTYKLEREKKEADRKRIEAGGIKDYNNTVESSLSEKILKWKGVESTLELSKSQNSKVIIIGAGKDGLPVILDTK